MLQGRDRAGGEVFEGQLDAYDLKKPVTETHTVNNLEKHRLILEREAAGFIEYVKMFNPKTWSDVNINELANFIENYRGGVVRPYTLEYLMNLKNQRDITRVARSLNFERFFDDADKTLDYVNARRDFFNLCYYINTSVYRKLPNVDSNYLSSLSVEELADLVGPFYAGPRDRASLLYAAVTGKSAYGPGPEDLDQDRYLEVSNYDPIDVFHIAQDLYNLYNEITSSVNSNNPYILLALHPKTPMEEIYISINNTNYQRKANEIGMIVPPGKDANYVKKNMVQYQDFINRLADTPPPPIIAGMTDEAARNIIKIYSDQELLDAYEPLIEINGTFTRQNLLDAVVREKNGGSIWSFRHQFCNNDDTFNVIEGEEHGKMGKDDPTNPTLSYGVPKNYRCYQSEELEESFRNYQTGTAGGEGEVFLFKVPDWTAGTIDPVTGNQLISEFPVDSIRQLKRLLANVPAELRQGVQGLKDKIDEGLMKVGDTARKFQQLEREFNNFPPEQQEMVKKYMAWLFMLGMWLRFWRGPGHDYPVRWVEGGDRGDLCDTYTRDEHQGIMMLVRARILEEMERANPELERWVLRLPLVSYNWITGEARLAGAQPETLDMLERNDLINFIILKTQMGEFCLAHGSDLIIQGGFYIPSAMFRFNEEEFNRFINDYMFSVLALEKEVVDAVVQDMQNRRVTTGKKYETYLSRQNALNQPIPTQPAFTTGRVGGTGHIDPYVGLDL